MPKSASTSKTSTRRRTTKGKAATPVTEDQRRQMIAEAAYYRAAERGFEGGDPLEDWLQAEAYITDQARH